MKSAGKLSIAAMTAALALACGTANAQRWHWHHRPYRIVTVAPRPIVTVHVSNRFSQKERLRIATAYLRSHPYLTVKKYAKMTGLPKASAEAELDAFAADKDKPIAAVIRGKKKLYVMKEK